MVRVIELGHIVAGPCAGLILSDLGHEVIKVEKPGAGDISRRLSKQSSGAFPFYNRNKKSLTLDLYSEDGKKIFTRLIESAEVIIDNLGPGAVKRAGFSYENIQEINPGIIYLSLKGYGKGPYENRKSLDYPIEVHSGLAYMTGLNGRPMRVGASMIDMSAAMFGVIGVLNAMLEKERTGKGKYIDVGMFETAAFFMGQHIATYQMSGIDMQPINEEGFAWGVYDFFRTRDGQSIFVAVTTDAQWKKFCQGFSLGFCNDEEYETNEKRFDRRDTLIPQISEKLSSMDSRDIEEILSEVNVSYAFLNKPTDLLRDSHMLGKMVTESFESKTLKLPEVPTGSMHTRDAPDLGQDTESLLKELGFDDSEIAGFKEEKAV